MEPIDLQDDDHRHVKAEEEEVICVKIKEEEISTDVSSDTENNTIFRNLEDEGKDASFNTWEEKMSINTDKQRPTRWGSRTSKSIRRSESPHCGPEPLESSSEEAEMSLAGFSQHSVISPRHNIGRGPERGFKRSRKRREETEFMESVMHHLNEMNEERSRHLKEMMSQKEIIMRQLRDDEDSDMLFLKSLLPLMKELPTPKKMECWTAMVDVMARFLAPSQAPAASSSNAASSYAPGPES
ncbi:uncharacterized protein ACNLHF_020419 isoform 1-T1 [Anomaloglossus baeobatrachus]|uniref:uncharacterized protein LOC142309901 isoform X1 n=1 Tax=Anomaloglossus baeobatrachus TaxID=238106 RepID=UPI003F50BD40